MSTIYNKSITKNLSRHLTKKTNTEHLILKLRAVGTTQQKSVG